MQGIRIAATGSYLPKRIVRSEELSGGRALAEKMGNLFETCNERRYARPDETSESMGIQAARAAIESLPSDRRDIDHVLYWAFCPDMETPREGSYIASALGYPNAGSTYMDVACGSFHAMLKSAIGMIGMGFHRRILIVAVANWSNRAFAPGEDLGPVGDGAGAMIVEACPAAETSFLGIAESRYARFERVMEMHSRIARTPDETLHSNWADGFREWCETEPIRFMRELLLSHGFTRGVDWFIPNQPTSRVNHIWREGLEMPENRMLTTFQRHGNLIAATLPVLLDTAKSEGNGPKSGDTGILFTTGLGFHLTAILWKF